MRTSPLKSSGLFTGALWEGLNSTCPLNDFVVCCLLVGRQFFYFCLEHLFLGKRRILFLFYLQDETAFLASTMNQGIALLSKLLDDPLQILDCISTTIFSLT
jgi:hypothetical protein